MATQVDTNSSFWAPHVSASCVDVGYAYKWILRAGQNKEDKADPPSWRALGEGHNQTGVKSGYEGPGAEEEKYGK